MTRHGAAVCINYLDASQASSVASQRAEVESVPINGRFYAAARFGGINVFVSNAGLCQFHDFLILPKELHDRTVRINLDGAFYATKATAKMIVAQGRRGLMIGRSSGSALVGGAGKTHFAPTKARVLSLMKELYGSVGQVRDEGQRNPPRGSAYPVERGGFER